MEVWAVTPSATITRLSRELLDGSPAFPSSPPTPYSSTPPTLHCYYSTHTVYTPPTLFIIRKHLIDPLHPYCLYSTNTLSIHSTHNVNTPPADYQSNPPTVSVLHLHFIDTVYPHHIVPPHPHIKDPNNKVPLYLHLGDL